METERVTESDRNGPVVCVPEKLLENFLQQIRDMGVEFTVESDSPSTKAVRMKLQADHTRVAAAIDKFNENHIAD